MVKKIKAAILREIDSPLAVEGLTLMPLKRGQVLAKIYYSGICRSQLMEQQGKRGKDRWLPHLLGHEGFAVVEEIGPDVSKCKVGDRVVLSWIQGEGIDSENPRYLSSEGAFINSGKVTTFSDYSVVSENRIFLAPNGFHEAVLPLFGCALLTGGGMAIKYGGLDVSQKICIMGFGGIGSAAALVLKGMGKTEIVIVEKSSQKRILAEKLGFSCVLEKLDNSMLEFDLVIESTGTIEGIEGGFISLNDQGVLVFASHPGENERISLNPHDLIKGKRIFGTWGGDVNPDLDITLIAKHILASKADLDLLLGEVFSIDQVNEGLAYLDSGKPGRPLLRLNEV
jgi:S-(hydroxymethyl)glutathione dehydrogenase / alcohol dehydrogenase